MKTVDEDITISIVQKRAQELYDRAWGEKWTREKKRLHRSEVDGDNGDDDRVGVWYSDVGGELEYEVVQEMDWVAKAVQAPTPLRADVVILNEYKTLLAALTDADGALSDGHQSVVVTGHPGIGKTTFLLFLLLYLLEHRQATALQLGSRYYIIFDAFGVLIAPINDINDDERLDECWALVDSNDQVVSPCPALLDNAPRVIQTTSPKIERWKDWSKHHDAELYIMDLPTVLEIGAITKEHKYDAWLKLTLTYVNKWGPCTRTFLSIMEDMRRFGKTDASDRRLQRRAQNGADTIINTPLLLRAFSLETDNRPAGPVDGISSGLLFVSPQHMRHPDGTVEVAHDSSIPIIPTKHLFDILVEQLCLIDRQNALTFFRTFASYSRMRASAGWVLEALVHARLGSNDPPLRIFRGEAWSMMSPSNRVIPGTLDALSGVAVDEAFYWRPDASTFPGIDGVLGTANGGIYAIQATIAHSHGSPVEGLKKVCSKLSDRLTARRDLHVVVVTDQDAVARRLVAQFEEYLEDKKFGPRGTQAVVWGCVLPLI